MCIPQQVARNLQDTLTFAKVKADNGWQNRTLSALEPEVTDYIRRKRPHSSGDILTDSSDDSEGDSFSSHIRPPIFSDKLPSSRHSNGSKKGKKTMAAPALPTHRAAKRVRSKSTANITSFNKPSPSWKTSRALPQSSPVYHHNTSSFNNHNSFVSDSAIIPAPDASPLFTTHHSIPQSDTDDEDLPLHSFNANNQSSSIISSSPPRTPPPTHSKKSSAFTKQTGAADLLLYLANSPSPAPTVKPRSHPSTANDPPSTPPSSHSLLPTTPTPNLLTNTPGQPGFNFADFCNITPSPAQAPWQTPGASKTPLIAKSRRGLTYEMGPPMSPVADRGSERRKSRGLALELGEELLPRA